MSEKMRILLLICSMVLMSCKRVSHYMTSDGVRCERGLSNNCGVFLNECEDGADRYCEQNVKVIVKE